MRTKLGNWTRLAVVVVAMTGTQVGCKTGWKMPGSDMFPWSKKPSEATLAGSSPGLSMPNSTSTSPMGPAYKNSPSTLANNTGMGGMGKSSPYGPPNASGPSFNMPPNNPMASNHGPNIPSMPNGAGVASGANGYTTGPYNMAGTASRPGGYTPQSGYGQSPQTPGAYGAAPPQNLAANTMAPAYGMPTGLPQPASAAAYPSMGTGGGIPAMPAAYSSAVVNAAPVTGSMPNALPATYPSSSGPAVANQSYSGAAPYRPGSVGRQTSYDFSNQGTAGALPPPIVPNTANGMPNSSPNTMYR